MLEIVELGKKFVLTEEFWKYHGYVLSLLWLGLSGVGVAVKSKSVFAHLLVFAIVDYGTLFLGGAALYRIYDHVENYTEPLIVIHFVLGKIMLILGISLMVFMLYQHIIGIIAYHKSTPNRIHRSLGKNIVIYGRIVAALGWLCT